LQERVKALVMPAQTLTDTPRLAPYLARGEKLASASSLVSGQDEFHAWRHQRNDWIATVSAKLIEAGMGYEAEDFRREATVRHPFSHWQLALDAEVNAVCSAIHELRRSLS
jgi:hypothetical protein